MKTKNIIIVINTLAEMLKNNAELGTSGIAESLRAYCEDGNAFYFKAENDEKFTEEDAEECCKIMERIDNFTENLCFELYKIFEENEKIYEVCPCCNEEMLIDRKGEKCSYCGKFIKPCSLCDMDKVKCNECKFDKK